MERETPSRDTAAWVLQSWASFIIAVSATAIGIWNMPADTWIRGYLGICLLFTVASTFTLAKTMRDLAEARRVSSVVQSAKVEEILAKRPL